MYRLFDYVFHVFVQKKNTLHRSRVPQAVLGGALEVAALPRDHDDLPWDGLGVAVGRVTAPVAANLVSVNRVFTYLVFSNLDSVNLVFTNLVSVNLVRSLYNLYLEFWFANLFFWCSGADGVRLSCCLIA